MKASRSEVPTPKTIDPNWLAGFSSGDGCFLVKIVKSSSHKLGARVQLRFTITQHSRDAELLKSLVNSFGCGKYYFREGQVAPSGEIFSPWSKNIRILLKR
uniref:Homing endonuclease LAGLIDADG domain-containing protein n=1 Tax=Morchella importuna TaxID=1174673 RepID=A0A650AFH8_9PEZI|nr:hypothetical protein [Morchella importuna]QGN66792.1 hypothetical protein [Morchella importuna]